VNDKNDKEKPKGCFAAVLGGIAAAMAAVCGGVGKVAMHPPGNVAEVSQGLREVRLPPLHPPERPVMRPPPPAEGGIPGRPPVGVHEPVPGIPGGGPREFILPKAPPGIHVVPGPVSQAEARAAESTLGTSLQKAHDLGVNKDWTALAAHLDRELRLPQLPAELRQSLDGVRVSGPRVEQLNEIQRSLLAGALVPPHPADVAALPGVRQAFDDLAAVDRVQAALWGRWETAPPLTRLEEDLAAFRRVCGDPALALQVEGCLACAARQGGHAELAEHLLPPGHTTEEFAGSLRDLKAAGPAKASGDGAVPAGAPVTAGLVPEAPEGVRAGTKEAAGAGLPPLGERVKATGKTARSRAAEQVREAAEVESCRLTQHLHLIERYAHALHERVRDRRERDDGEQADDAAEAHVAKALGHPLTPSERVLVRALRRKGETPDRIAAELSRLQAPAAK
jgi:hypothetical protein